VYYHGLKGFYRIDRIPQGENIHRETDTSRGRNLETESFEIAVLFFPYIRFR